MNTIPHSNGTISEEQTVQKKDRQSLAVKSDDIKLFWLDAEQNVSTALHTVLHNAFGNPSSDAIVDDIKVLQKLLDDEDYVESHHHSPQTLGHLPFHEHHSYYDTDEHHNEDKDRRK